MKFWGEQVSSFAKLPLLISGLSRTQVMIAAAGVGARHNAVVSPHEQQQLQQQAAHAGAAAASSAPSNGASASRKYRSDSPESFVFCAVCSRYSHCTWRCRSLAWYFRRHVTQSHSAKAVAKSLMDTTRSAYAAKGTEFLSNFKSRPGLSLSALLGAAKT